MQPPREIPPVSRVGPVSPAPVERRPPGHSRPAADQVSLSPEGRELLSLLRQTTGQTPEVREELVERLRAEIARGQYRPSAREIARHLLGVLRPRP